MSSHIVILLLFLYLPLSYCKTSPVDKEALRLFKASITPSSIPPSSCLASWDFSPSSDPCDSLFSATLFTCGIRCDINSSSGLSHVTEISLDPAGYTGTLSSSFWSLPFLQSLDLPDNLLSGSLPSPTSLTPIPPIRRFTLSRNSFSGDLPPALLLPTLEELYLDGNRLCGSLPNTLPDLPNLKRLELQVNNLTGELPTNMQMLKGLYFLDLSDNAISGFLPSSLPPSLVELSMRNNQLQGPLPANLYSVPYLQVMDLSHNQLFGQVPGTLFSHPSLEQLVLAGNHLSSLEAPPWGSTSQLVALDVAQNEVTGMLPAWLAGLPRLSALSLEGNRITGMIPWAYAARAFSRLLLAGNYLYGPIPSPLMVMKEGSAMVSLADNCLFRCPQVFFFCQGARQKAVEACREFNPFIP